MTDRTLQAVTLQLAAMGCPSFEIGVKDAATASGKMMNREWSRDEVIANLRWLKHMNARDNHIYVRPKADWHHLVLVDDLKSDTLERMWRAGVEPALLVETSPQNYQVWISVAQPSRKIVSPEIRAAIAQRMVEDYCGDPGSADAKHYGRLAGFTNRKPERQQKDGRYPWVLLREHGGQPASAAADLVAVAEASLQEQERQKEQLEQQKQEQQAARSQITQPATRSDSEGTRSARSAVDMYCSEMKGFLNQYGTQIADDSNTEWSWSRCDFIAVKKLLERGYDREAVAEAMREASPGLGTERKAGRVDWYIQRTIDKAAEAVARDRVEPPVKSREVRPEPSSVDVDLDSFLSVTSGCGLRPRSGSG